MEGKNQGAAPMVNNNSSRQKDASFEGNMSPNRNLDARSGSQMTGDGYDMEGMDRSQLISDYGMTGMGQSEVVGNYIHVDKQIVKTVLKDLKDNYINIEREIEITTKHERKEN